MITINALLYKVFEILKNIAKGRWEIELDFLFMPYSQSAEKILKGFLADKNIDPPKTHDLRLLWRMCGEIADDFDNIEEACVRLTAYGVQPRYPMEIELSEKGAKR